MRRWLAAHLLWAVSALLALWAPPLLFALGVDFGLISDAPFGWSVLKDPSVATTAVMVLCMAAAAPLLSSRRPMGWWLLAAATVAAAAHGAWGWLSLVRPAGLGALASRQALFLALLPVAAAAVLAAVRDEFQPGARGERDRRHAA